MTHPHVSAAFINAISEEGTKEEAVDFLQKQWNENCALRKALAKISGQMTSNEMDEDQQDRADWQHGYDTIIEVARSALSPFAPAKRQTGDQRS